MCVEDIFIYCKSARFQEQRQPHKHTEYRKKAFLIICGPEGKYHSYALHKVFVNRMYG